ENKYLLENGFKQFDPDFYMAQSWQRLREGKNIKKWI
ncbi:TPA: phage head morphogenesis protein, partial [Staphylococcus aureus]|nr:phage head morphogenesis protein [Staphylococcus aureus]